MKVDEETWAEIRRLWCETTEPVLRIAARFGVGKSTIPQRAVREGWPDRPSGAVRVVPKPLPGAPGKKRKRVEPREPAAPEARVRKLLAIIDLQLEQLERDMASSDELTVQDRERLGRSLTNTIGSLEKVMEVNAEHDRGRASRDGRTNAGRDADQLRDEIAARLERLNAQWQAQQRAR